MVGECSSGSFMRCLGGKPVATARLQGRGLGLGGRCGRGAADANTREADADAPPCLLVNSE